MVRYPAKAAGALAYLKRAYNDYDIFVEDTSNPNMWLRLLKKMLPPNAKIASVNMLGGKANVLAACKLVQHKSPKRTLYIIDGDFDFLLGLNKPRLKHLYRLRAYCVENVLLTENAAIEIGVSSSVNKSPTEIANLLRYSDWKSEITKKLAPLFAIYAVAARLCPPVQTVGYPVQSLFLQVNGNLTICAKKVRARMHNVARDIRKTVGQKKLSAVLKEVRSRLGNLNINMTISGKDYLLPYLYLLLGKRLKFAGTIEMLKVRFAEYATSANEPWLARRLQSL